MADIQFPSLMPILQLQRQDTQNALLGARERRLTQQENEERIAQQYVGPALQGDQDALAKLPPRMAMQLAPLLDRLDHNKRTKLKETADWTTGAALGVLNAPAADRAATYKAAIEEGKARGYDLSRLPTDYTPAVDGLLRYHVARAEPIAEYFKRQEGMPTPIGGAPGPAPQGQPSGSILGTILNVESGGRNVPQAIVDSNTAQGTPAQGYFQITNPTWMDFGGGNTPHKSAIDAPYETQLAIAQNIPVARWGPTTQAALRQAGYTPQPGETLGQMLTRYGQDPNSTQPSGGAAPPSAAPQPAQGDAAQPGAPPQQPDAMASVRGVQLPPGARMVGVKGVPIVKDGTVMVQMPDGQVDFVPLPQRKEPGNQPPAGPFGGTGMDAQAYNLVLKGDPSSPDYAAAYAHLAAPKVQIDQQTGQMTQIKPDMSWARPPVTTQAAGGGTTGQRGVSVENVPGMAPRMTAEQARDAGFADRMLNSSGILDKVAPQGTETVGRVLESLPWGAGNFAQTKDYQSFKQARDDFINAQLRRESGAAINKDEYVKADQQYFPIPGDKDTTIAQKAKNRAVAVEAMKRGAGPAYKPSDLVGGQPAAPKPGDVVDGYLFNGGDPSKKENWRKAP